MNRDGCFSLRWLGARVSVAGVVALLAAPAFADLTNKYTFNDGTANDSVGVAHGNVVDPTGISRYVGGQLDVSANTGELSAQDFSLPTTRGAYVNLPNGIVSEAFSSGTPGAASFETWVTVQTNRNWAELFSFGLSNQGEDMSGSGAQTDYITLIPQTGTTPQFHRITTHAAGVAAEGFAETTPLPTGVQHHIVVTADHNDLTDGANGTLKLYLNNNLVDSGPIADLIDLGNMLDDNNWLGRSQWNDPLFDGTYNEFRIYNHALDQAEVTDSFNTGPDFVATPTLVVDRATGAISVANQTTAPLQLKGYSISSTAGSLNPATWTSIDADNTFDPNGTWTSQSSTSTNLAESVTGGTLDGGSLGASGSRSIGSPWLKTPFQDLVFSYTLGDNTTGFGIVQYDGTAVARSDLNGDGQINVADWTIFIANGYTNMSAETAVGAYRRGDLDGDRDNDIFDFRLFKADYIAANGAAAFADLEGAVPEPSTIALVVISIFAVFRFGVGRRRDLPGITQR